MVELSDISRTGYDFIGWGGNGSKYITGYQAYSSTAGDNCATQSFECSTPTAVAFNGTNKAVALGTDYKYKGTNYYTASVWAKWTIGRITILTQKEQPRKLCAF